MHEQALTRLLEGNERFRKGQATGGSGVGPERRRETANRQAPFAAILTCADSRVTPATIFDAGLGDLFVCRNAGNQAGTLVTGSLEFAVSALACPLIVVLGHSSCGAVQAAVRTLRAPETEWPRALGSVVEGLLPAARDARPANDDEQAWAAAAERRNVERVCRDLLRGSALLAERVAAGATALAGMWYDLTSGRVEVLLAPPVRERPGSPT